MNFKIAIFDPIKHAVALDRFFTECGVENNSSMDAMGFYKRTDSMMTLVMAGGRILNTSYAHDFSDYYPDTYRVFTRTATVPDYRGRGISLRKDMTMAAGLAALTCPIQVDHARINGAKNIYFTTNLPGGGMASSAKLGGYLQKIVDTDPRFEFVEQKSIYGCEQLVWRLLFKDILAEPPRHPL